MPFIIVQKDNPDLVYCGPDKGWENANPPPPPKPGDAAVKYDTQEEAVNVIITHGMNAVSKAV